MKPKSTKNAQLPALICVFPNGITIEFPEGDHPKETFESGGDGTKAAAAINERMAEVKRTHAISFRWFDSNSRELTAQPLTR